MGRRRLNRSVKTFSLGADTIQFLDDLKLEKHSRNLWRTHQITLSEILDEAVGMLYHARITELHIVCPECYAQLSLKPSKESLKQKHQVIKITCFECQKRFNLAEAERVKP